METVRWKLKNQTNLALWYLGNKADSFKNTFLNSLSLSNVYFVLKLLLFRFSSCTLSVNMISVTSMVNYKSIEIVEVEPDGKYIRIKNIGSKVSPR